MPAPWYRKAGLGRRGHYPLPMRMTLWLPLATSHAMQAQSLRGCSPSQSRKTMQSSRTFSMTTDLAISAVSRSGSESSSSVTGCPLLRS